MKLIFRQRMFSWLDSYDIFNEHNEVVFTVEGQLSFGHCLHVLDAFGEHVATLQEKFFSFFPEFHVIQNDAHIGSISKEFSLFKPSFCIDYKGWSVLGEFFEWDYQVVDEYGNLKAEVSKELFNWTDTYVIDVKDEEDALDVLMLVLAIDAEKCSRKN